MRLSSCLLLLALLTGCGMLNLTPSMHDIARKAEKARTRNELEEALGKPAKFEKTQFFGVSGENWTYEGSDGDVQFVLIDGKVKTVATIEKKKK